MNFQEIMADACHQTGSVRGKVVVELASDPWFHAASKFQELGAARVIASDILPAWRNPAPDGVEALTMDARAVDTVLGQNACDIIFGVNLLEHLPSLDVAFAAMYRALKPDGWCFLHGHPLWTSACGHHAMIGDFGADILFHNDTNPVPPWAHLFMDPDELRAVLEQRALNTDNVAAVLDWVFTSDAITRTPGRAIADAAEASPLALVNLWEDVSAAPSEDVFARIRKSRWFDPEERYDVRGLTMVLQKRPGGHWCGGLTS